MTTNQEDDLARVLIRERATITAYAQSIVLDWDLAEDVYQNAAIVALRKMDQVTEAEGILWWILAITRFEALKALEQRKDLPSPFSEETLDLLDSSWKQYMNTSKANLVGQSLEYCIKKLTERNQEILRMRYSEGMSGVDVAEALGKSPNTYYVAMSRIHRQLRACIRREVARELG